MNLKDKTVLLTGASKGIGKATAITCAKQGASVVIVYKSDENGAQEVLAACNEHSTGNTTYKADVSIESEVEELLSNIRESFESIDILINNAGIFDDRDSVESIEALDNVYKTNFKSVAMMVKYSLPLMKLGKIINISSIHGKIGQGRPEAIAYSAFKAALNSYTKNLAKGLAPNILVNAIAPGRVATPMWGNLTPEVEKELGEVHAINRMIKPEEIADSVLFLINNDAMCGEILTIDGGYSLFNLD